jgi:uroporphyrinogen decarboxylase
LHKSPDHRNLVLPKPLLAALRGELTPRVPIWLMRQAGRYLPEYREIRARTPRFFERCYTPELVVEITLQPVRRFGMDGAILFSDILVVVDALGGEVEILEGRGPVVEPLADARALERLSAERLRPHLEPVYEAVRLLARALPERITLIGFAGAPWTLAAYMVEGETSRDFHRARRLARAEPDLFARLIGLLIDATSDHLMAQIEAGAEAVQIFDSWAGLLPETEFERWCVRPVLAVAERVKARHPAVPVIVFPRGVGAGYRRFRDEPAVDGLSLDATVPLLWAREELAGVCLQGNLDPIALLAGGAVVERETDRILDALAGRPFVFNLGHGVLPETDPAEVQALVERVQRLRPPIDPARHRPAGEAPDDRP